MQVMPCAVMLVLEVVEQPDLLHDITRDGVIGGDGQCPVVTGVYGRDAVFPPLSASPHVGQGVSGHSLVTFCLKHVQCLLVVAKGQVVMIVPLQQVGYVEVHFGFQFWVGGRRDGTFRPVIIMYGGVDLVHVVPMPACRVPVFYQSVMLPAAGLARQQEDAYNKCDMWFHTVQR